MENVSYTQHPSFFCFYVKSRVKKSGKPNIYLNYEFEASQQTLFLALKNKYKIEKRNLLLVLDYIWSFHIGGRNSNILSFKIYIGKSGAYQVDVEV